MIVIVSRCSVLCSYCSKCNLIFNINQAIHKGIDVSCKSWVWSQFLVNGSFLESYWVSVFDFNFYLMFVVSCFNQLSSVILLSYAPFIHGTIIQRGKIYIKKNFYKHLLSSACLWSRAQLAINKIRNISRYQITNMVKIWF